ncbi:MAG: Zinc ribbon protein [Candidatus Thermoplasmatota archaeon]|nr:Zinc ribbon protein [Candidatus Thermoplasmatota archaeon]
MNVCPYCGHDFRVQPQGPVRESLSGGVRVLLYLVSFLVPVVGIILGIVFMVRADPEYKRMGKICLILGVVAIVVEIGLAAVLYVMVLGFSGPDVHTPVTTLTGVPADDGWKFIIGPINSEVTWTEVSILVTTLDGTVGWTPSASDLTGGVGTTYDYGAETLGALSVTLTVTDISGDGHLEFGDYFIFTASPGFSAEEDYTVALIYEPTDGIMANAVFSG